MQLRKACETFHKLKCTITLSIYNLAFVLQFIQRLRKVIRLDQTSMGPVQRTTVFRKMQGLYDTSWNDRLWGNQISHILLVRRVRRHRVCQVPFSHILEFDCYNTTLTWKSPHLNNDALVYFVDWAVCSVVGTSLSIHQKGDAHVKLTDKVWPWLCHITCKIYIRLKGFDFTIPLGG